MRAFPVGRLYVASLEAAVHSFDKTSSTMDEVLEEVTFPVATADTNQLCCGVSSRNAGGMTTRGARRTDEFCHHSVYRPWVRRRLARAATSHVFIVKRNQQSFNKKHSTIQQSFNKKIRAS
jgi:hypothetical protein